MSTTTFARDNFWAAAKTATDSWTHSKNLPAWEHSYEQLKPGAFSGTFTFACLGPLQLVHEKVGGPGVYRGRSWKGSRIFFSVEGSGLRYNNRLVSEHRLGSHRWDGLDLVTSRESVSMTLMAIDEQWLCGRLAETPEAQVLFRGNGRPALLQSDPELVRTFEREVQGMLRELIAQPTILECPVSRASLQGDAIELLIRMLAGRGASGATMPAPSTRAYVVDRALQYVDSKLADPVSIPDICQAVR